MPFDDEMFSFTASPWITSDDQSWESILAFGTLKKYKKGDIIIDIGNKSDQLYYLAKGQVRMEALAKTGTEKTIWFINSPNVFGEVPFFNELPSLFMIVAVKNSEVYCFDRQFVDEHLIKHPAAVKYMFRLFAQKIRVLSSQINDYISNNPLERGAKLLYVLALQRGEHIAKGSYVINIKLTHQELANITGLHRVTATNSIRKLVDLGIIEKNRENIIVKDLSALLKIIEENVE